MFPLSPKSITFSQGLLNSLVQETQRSLTGPSAPGGRNNAAERDAGGSGANGAFQ